MNQKIPFHELAKRLSAVNSISDESAEVFIKNFFDLLGELIVDGETVRIKGLGSFATVGAGNERVVEFIPDKDISDTLNAPFASFEPVELNVDVTAEMLSEFDAEERPQVEDMQLPKVEVPEVEHLSEETVINTDKTESDQNESEPALQVEPVQEIEFDKRRGAGYGNRACAKGCICRRAIYGRRAPCRPRATDILKVYNSGRRTFSQSART